MTRHATTAFIHSNQFEQYELGPYHPFKPTRSKAVFDLCNKKGLLDHSWMRVVEPDRLETDTMATFHDPDYLRCIREANTGVFQNYMIEFNLGTGDCPIFKGIYDYVTLSCGAGYKGMKLLESGEAQTVFSPTGGFHHAGRRHAEGFCYVNDVGIIIEALLAKDRRIAYIDIDAHHCNGIQDAFYGEGRVLKISLHETGETLYPWGGFEGETGSGEGAFKNVNVPLPTGTDDELYVRAFDEIVPPLVTAFDPDIIISVIGCDTLAADPLTHLSLTNNGFNAVIKRMNAMGKPLLMLGGGGYNEESLARAWTLAWATLNGVEPEEEHVGTIGGVLLGDREISAGGLRDMRRFAGGPERDRIEEKIERVTQTIKRVVFPAHGL